MSRFSNRTRIYIAGPMSQGDKLHNLHQALVAYRTLIAAGFAPLCPQLTFLVDRLIEFPHQTWLDIDLPWVDAADVVLRLPGESVGADQETARATARGIPVYHCPVHLIRSIRPAA